MLVSSKWPFFFHFSWVFVSVRSLWHWLKKWNSSTRCPQLYRTHVLRRLPWRCNSRDCFDRSFFQPPSFQEKTVFAFNMARCLCARYQYFTLGLVDIAFVNKHSLRWSSSLEKWQRKRIQVWIRRQKFIVRRNVRSPKKIAVHYNGIFSRFIMCLFNVSKKRRKWPPFEAANIAYLARHIIFRDNISFSWKDNFGFVVRLNSFP